MEIKYYKIYRWEAYGYEEYNWYYQTLALAEEVVKDWEEDWLINEVEIVFYDDGLVGVFEETVLEKGE